jgi:hypothetical protein
VASELLSKIVVFSAVLALLAAGAITLSSKLPKLAAALESINRAIVATHLKQVAPDLALP